MACQGSWLDIFRDTGWPSSTSKRTFYAWVERPQQFSTVQGHYTSYWAPKFYVGNQIPGAVVDYRLPEHGRDLPPALELPNRFLVASQFGCAPLMYFGVPLARDVSMARVLD